MSLRPITCDEFEGLSHGFFTRQGGVSTGIYGSLNCGAGSADDFDNVTQNRALVANHFGNGALTGVHQVHSADVVIVTEQQTEQSPRPKADGLVTAQMGISLSILTADCQPVLFADLDNRVIGAAHAGWGGALSGILEATVEAMVSAGAKRDKIDAVIGPTISQKSYEVGPEFFDRFIDDDPENHRFFAAGRGDRLQFDLPSYGLSRLRNAGVRNARWTGHCTYEDPDKFFSYRRSVHLSEPDYGRLISGIRL